ncbi:MAG: hypothetical protein WBA12_14825, partial [Catalinimonas sp.]
MTVRREKSGLIAVVLLVWLLLILPIDPRGNFPLNDDWRFAAPVQSLLEAGELRVRGLTAPNLMAQVAWGYLFA